MSWDGFCVLWGLVSASRFYVNVRTDITLDRSVCFLELAKEMTAEDIDIIMDMIVNMSPIKRTPEELAAIRKEIEEK